MGEPLIALTDAEKARVRYHMGYLQATIVDSIALGVPAATQPMFLVESAMNRLPVSGAAYVRQIVAKMDALEDKITQAADYLAATKLGEMDVNPEYPELLEREYVRWARRLQDTLGAPLNPFAARFNPQGTGQQPMVVGVLS